MCTYGDYYNIESVPDNGETVVTGKQDLIKSVGLGIQLPLLWHVTFKISLSVVLMLDV